MSQFRHFNLGGFPSQKIRQTRKGIFLSSVKKVFVRREFCGSRMHLSSCFKSSFGSSSEQVCSSSLSTAGYFISVLFKSAWLTFGSRDEMFSFIQMSWIYSWPGCLPWGVGAAEQLQTQEHNCCVFLAKPTPWITLQQCLEMRGIVIHIVWKQIKSEELLQERAGRVWQGPRGFGEEMLCDTHAGLGSAVQIAQAEHTLLLLPLLPQPFH